MHVCSPISLIVGCVCESCCESCAEMLQTANDNKRPLVACLGEFSRETVKTMKREIAKFIE